MIKKIISVVGTRPNFIKIAPIHKAIKKIAIHNFQHSINHLICHTGQHYDEKMSKIFFEELDLPKPDYYLGIGGGSHAQQTAKIMIEFEQVLLKEMPDLVIVAGDVNSTMACSLTAVKYGIKVAHIEAGLRSFDRSMPEEINRVITDAVSDYLFVTERSGLENLKREGVAVEKIFFVGNCMIDSLLNYLPKINESKIIHHYSLKAKDYIVATFHRPSNVDSESNLAFMIELLNQISVRRKVIFPVHPRTKRKLESHLLLSTLNPDIILTEPIGYIDFLALVMNSLFVITDSGGIQEETTFLSVPCITLRRNTERPSTTEIGTNYLVGENLSDALKLIPELADGKARRGHIPELWDGKASDRIIDILIKILDEPENKGRGF